MSYRLVQSATPLIRLLRFVLPQSGTLIIPPAGAGSLGDEAMVEGLAGRLAERGEGPVFLYAREGRVEWPVLDGVDTYRTPGSGLIRGARLLAQLLRRKRVFVIGADCIDGHYSVRNSVQLIRLADIFARCGASSTIVGSSYKENAKPETGEALRDLSNDARLCARDAVSGERMRRVTDHEVVVVADAAFMVSPRPENVPDAVRNWIASERKENRRVLAVNYNRQVIKDDREAQRELLDSYVSTIQRLIGESAVSVLFVPHDYRGDENDLTNAEEIRAKLGEACADHALVAPGRLAPSTVKAMVADADAALTGRMHLAIACLGSTTPPACVTYQGKFDGLFRHFELEKMTIDPVAACDPEQLFGLVSDVLGRSDDLRSRIADRKPGVLRLSESNLGIGSSDA